MDFEDKISARIFPVVAHIQFIYVIYSLITRDIETERALVLTLFSYRCLFVTYYVVSSFNFSQKSSPIVFCSLWLILHCWFWFV